jgi:hypothetical protein
MKYLEKSIGKITIGILLFLSVFFIMSLGFEEALPIIGWASLFSGIGYGMWILVLKFLRKLWNKNN